MKTLFRNTLFYSFALALLPTIIPGVVIEEGLVTLLILGFTLMLLYSVLRPILNIISLPINIITIGFFSILINTFLLYLLTVLVPSITISEFYYEGWSYAGFVIPQTDIGVFFAYVLSAITISVIISFLNWLTD